MTSLGAGLLWALGMQALDSSPAPRAAIWEWHRVRATGSFLPPGGRCVSGTDPGHDVIPRRLAWRFTGGWPGGW